MAFIFTHAIWICETIEILCAIESFFQFVSSWLYRRKLFGEFKSIVFIWGSLFAMVFANKTLLNWVMRMSRLLIIRPEWMNLVLLTIPEIINRGQHSWIFIFICVRTKLVTIILFRSISSWWWWAIVNEQRNKLMDKTNKRLVESIELVDYFDMKQWEGPGI